MNRLEAALLLAQSGFHVFPLQPNSKIPAIKDFPNIASRDEQQIRNWFGNGVDYNVGVSTTKFRDNQALVVVDIDQGKGKDGYAEIDKLKTQGYEFPKTFYQNTPNGGMHLVYYADSAVKQGSSVLAKGIDIRSKGGYIVGFGSKVDGKEYEGIGLLNTAACPKKIMDTCGLPPKKKDKENAPTETIPTAINRAIEWLRDVAPVAVEGDGGDHTTFKVACKLKDLGVSRDDAMALLMEYWNDRCFPAWPRSDLQKKVDNAFEYSADTQGNAAPEMEFAPVDRQGTLHPVEKLNKHYAYVITGGSGHIIWETKDEKGDFKVEHIKIQAFHQLLAAETMATGNNRQIPISEVWMKSSRRRTYKGICFLPGKPTPKGYYNLWRGFKVEPPKKSDIFTPKAHKSLELFKEHLAQNVCGDDPELIHWLTSYFAQMVQEPYNKPLTALVFKGAKGVGKNALVDCLGYILGSHYLLTSNRRYLIGNFNAHLEKLILLTFDEAFWSGDKQAEGILKDLITGKAHVVERKGKETYQVDNKTRVIILGNEEWLVPASHDERRYAVFNVGEKQKRDYLFFIALREGMEEGGYRLLLQYLLNYKIDGVNLSEPPKTQGLLDQKDESLSPFHRWWKDCLLEERILGSDFEGWPEEVERDSIREAYIRYLKKNNVRSRAVGVAAFGKLLKECAPGIGTHRKTAADGSRPRTYVFPVLPHLRGEWDQYVGQEGDWEESITD